MKGIFNVVGAYYGMIIGPNNDPGHSGIRKAITEFLGGGRFRKRWRYVDNLAREDFLRALFSADILVGNSSCGIVEANTLGTAVVNIGARQAGRQRNGRAVFDSGYDREDIKGAVSKALSRSESGNICGSRAFGDGQTGLRIAEILSGLPKSESLISKHINL